MSRKGSIDLVDEVEENLEQMIKAGIIKDVKVKAMLEHLRSALEYVAHDTYVQFNPKKEVPKNIYFPYGHGHVDTFFKRVGIPTQSSSLYQIFESIQDYKNKDKWLTMMCNLTNEVKHRNPIPLDTNEVITKTFSAGGKDLVVTSGNVSVKIGSIVIDGKTSPGFKYEDGILDTTSATIPINLKITKDQKISFHGTTYEVYPFIKKCSSHIREFVNLAYNELEITR